MGFAVFEVGLQVVSQSEKLGETEAVGEAVHTQGSPQGWEDDDMEGCGVRLIDADALMADIKTTIEDSGCVSHEGEILACIAYADTIDAAPLARGKWIDFRAHDADWLRNDGKSVFIECSVCHEKLCRNLMLSVSFCPNCGAKMEVAGE